MTTTPTDPGTIDLDELIKSLRTAASMYSAPGAVALLGRAEDAIEALRARVAELEVLAIDDQSGKSWRKIALHGESEAGEIDRIASEYLVRADAAEARVAELAGALDGIRAVFEEWSLADQAADTPAMLRKFGEILAATPAEALERARAVEEVVKMARLVAEARAIEVESTPLRQKALRSALAKLDALGNEGP